jgi:hypothetical protein
MFAVEADRRANRVTALTSILDSRHPARGRWALVLLRALLSAFVLVGGFDALPELIAVASAGPMPAPAEGQDDQDGAALPPAGPRRLVAHAAPTRPAKHLVHAGRRPVLSPLPPPERTDPVASVRPGDGAGLRLRC